MSLPGTRTLTLQEEAEMLLRYTALQRAEYLHEVWTNPKRGPAQAHELQRAIAEALRGGEEIAMTGTNHAF